MALNEDDIERARLLLAKTVGVLCRNSIRYGRELQVQGLIGVTVDGKQVFLVSISELFLKAEDASKVKEKHIGFNSVADGNFRDVKEVGGANSRSLSQLKAPSVQSAEGVPSLSAGQLLTKCSRNPSGICKADISSQMEVSTVHGLAGINQKRRSAENSLRASRSPCKKSCLPIAGLSVDDVKHDADRPQQINLKRWTDGQKNSQVANILPVNTDSESVCGAEDCDRLFYQDNGDARTIKLSKDKLPSQFDDSEQFSTGTAMRSDCAMQRDGLIEFIKREVESPSLTIKSEDSSCSTENGTNAAENESLDMRCSEEVPDLVSTDHPYWQPELQYNAAFNSNCLGDVNVYSLGEPFGAVDGPEFVVGQNKDRVCRGFTKSRLDKSRSVHQCEYANCGLRFCHRSHLLGHQTLKHGRPKGRSSRLSALPLTIEALSAARGSYENEARTSSLPTFLSEMSAEPD